jgi:hypothetical protein
MKVGELNQIINNVISEEVRKNIIKESEESNKEVYHIKCEGVPLATFATEEEAQEALPDYQDKSKDGELIIEKGTYESHDDMIDKLDEMNDQLEETDDTEVDEELIGGQTKLDKNDNGKIDAEDFKMLKGEKSSDEEEEEVDEEKEECDECGNGYMEEEGDDKFERILRGKRKHSYSDNGGEEEEEELSEGTCEKCGKELCECGGGMYESKKKTLRLTESELVKLIGRMVNESVPGLEAAKKSHRESGKENEANLKSVETKMKKQASFNGNDNPEFPKAIGKGEKVARKNTPAQEDEIAKNFAGLENLDYDIEPSEQFKKRLKQSIEGHALMGNAPTTEKPSIKPSNGADKGKEAEDKDGNVIPTPETAKKIQKQVVNRQKDKDNRVLYSKEPVPTKAKQVNEEIEKMKNMFRYNKKTQ